MKPSHTLAVAVSTVAAVALGTASNAQATTVPVPEPVTRTLPAFNLTADTALHLKMMPSRRHRDHYRIRRGDTLSKIAHRVYGHANRWPSLWWINKRKIHNPNMIRVGRVLRLSDWHPRHVAWLDRAAMNAIPKPKPPRRVIVAAAPAPAAQSAPAAPAPQPAPAAAPAPVTAGGSFQQCVIQRESGGDPTAVNPASGAGGLYQFLPSTWAALGHSGSPQNASVAEQNQAFQQEYAQGGTSAWSPYDGC